jgi:hypothetical protein
MNIYGTRARRIRSHDLTGSACEACWYGPLIAHVFQKYFHICGLPLIPLEKDVLAECPDCKRAVWANDLRQKRATNVTRARAEWKAPRVVYASGVVALVLVALGLLFS